MEKFKLKPCPFCGKKPSVVCTLILGSGAYVQIQCKSFFRRKHLSVTYCDSTEERAFSIAAVAWNRSVDYGKIVLQK